MEEIIKLLECPVCFQHSISDTYLQCRNGHSGCLECYSRLKNCPICRTLLRIPTIKTFSKETTTAFQLRYFQVTKIGHGTALLKALTYHFKCTLCNQIPTRRNIWQCREGHIKCSECQNPPLKVSECHLCEDDLSLAGYRSIFAEKLVSLVIKSCRYVDRGCKAAILDLTNHENDECVFRDVRCIFLQCHEVMPMDKFLSHLQQLHRFHYFISWDAIVSKTIGSFDLPEKFLGFPVDKCHKITHLKLSDNKRFFFVFSAIAVLCTFVAWVYYADFPSSEAKNFGFHLKLFKEGSDHT
jgi:hypothetical protein